MSGRAPSNSRAGSITILIILLTTTVLSLLLYWHLYLNGTRFHSVTWHRAPFWPLFLWIPLAAAPVFVAAAFQWRRIAVPLALLMTSCFVLQFIVATYQHNEFNLHPLIRDVHSPLATSYFLDAEDLATKKESTLSFLRTYPQRMPALHYHSRNKPPMPILYYRLMLQFWPERDRAALAGIVILALLASSAIPATYWMILELTGNRAAAFHACTSFMLFPALLIFLPEFDQLYVPLCALAVASWSRGRFNQNPSFAILAALSICVATLFAFNILVMGAFLIAMLFVPRHATAQHLRPVLISLATALLFYGLLYLATGYNPFATLRQGMINAKEELTHLHRPWPHTIPTDLTYFTLDFAWIGMIVLASFFIHWRHHRPHLLISTLCVAQPLLVALTGLLQAETPRQWLFMTPLLMVPIGLEMTRWPRSHRLALLLCQVVLLAFVTQNLRIHP
ncbi:MAG TPA: hypothetical protein VF669_16895 [Tepidisphaeraceae bacterium]|jgi:hypothetical protein